MVRFLSAAVALAVLAGGLRADSPYLKNPVVGNPMLKSISALAFGPGGLLVIGDSKGSQVVVIETGDLTPKPWSKTELANITSELAGRIGATAKSIEILKVAVNPDSQTAYIAVSNKDTQKDLVLTVDGSGKVGELALDKVKHARVALPTDTPITLITDLAWGKDRILVAAQASETFGSKVFSIPTPIDRSTKGTVFSTETFHIGHNKWETKAPIRNVIPYEEEGKNYVVGTFTCTPIVKYPIDDLQSGAKVKGVSVVELGTGNTPQDMFAYEKDGKKYILMNTVRNNKKAIGPSPYWTFKVDQTLLKETDKINEKAIWRVKTAQVESLTDRAVVAPAYHGVTKMDRLDRERALAVRTDDKGNFSLVVLPLP